MKKTKVLQLALSKFRKNGNALKVLGSYKTLENDLKYEDIESALISYLISDGNIKNPFDKRVLKENGYLEIEDEDQEENETSIKRTNNLIEKYGEKAIKETIKENKEYIDSKKGIVDKFFEENKKSIEENIIEEILDEEPNLKEIENKLIRYGFEKIYIINYKLRLHIINIDNHIYGVRIYNNSEKIQFYRKLRKKEEIGNMRFHNKEEVIRNKLFKNVYKDNLIEDLKEYGFKFIGESKTSMDFINKWYGSIKLLVINDTESKGFVYIGGLIQDMYKYLGKD